MKRQNEVSKKKMLKYKRLKCNLFLHLLRSVLYFLQRNSTQKPKYEEEKKTNKQAVGYFLRTMT